MDRGLYIAMTGAKHTMLEQSVRAHNLANAQTTGFKADLANAMSQPVLGGDGYQSRVYAVAETPATNFSFGPQNQTGRELDVAIDGDGWMVLQEDNLDEVLTRAGNLMVDSVGILRAQNGLPVMGTAGPIAIPESEKIEIGADGTISVRALGQGSEALVIVDRIKLVNPALESLTKREDGMMVSEAGIEPVDVDVRLRTGFLEESNVNPVDELTAVVALARQYEMQVKMMQTISELAQSTSRVLQVQV